MTIALLIVIALLFCFIAHQIATVARALADEFRRRENIRDNTRRHAEESLREAYRDHTDPKFKEVDYNLGDGRGYRWAERMVNAKTWAEVEEIASGDPERFKEELERELDEQHRKEPPPRRAHA